MFAAQEDSGIKSAASGTPCAVLCLRARALIIAVKIL
jgi:hypothetical protein